MKSSQEIVSFIASRIGHIYFRPLMYGGTAFGVNLLLYQCHEFWAESMECRSRFSEIFQHVNDEEDCGSAGFAFHYLRMNPNSSEEEQITYIVQQWKKVSERLGIPIPYHEIEKMSFNAKHIGLIANNK